MRDSNQPLQMTGKEILQTFGAREVLELEQAREGVLIELDTLRKNIEEHWDDDEILAREQGRIDELLSQLRTLSSELRAKRNKYGSAMDSTTPLAPLS